MRDFSIYQQEVASTNGQSEVRELTKYKIP